jgi:hypothetical protein
MKYITIPVVFEVADDDIVDHMALVNSISIDISDMDEVSNVNIDFMNSTEEAAE